MSLVLGIQSPSMFDPVLENQVAYSLMLLMHAAKAYWNSCLGF